MTPTLLAEGYKVTVLDNLSFQQGPLLDCCANPNFDFIKGDVCNQGMVGEGISKFDVVIPLAAIVGAPACKVNPGLSRMINYDAIRFMADKMSPRQKVLFPTTNSGYGVGEKNSFCTEQTPLRPISQYGVDKVEI